MDSSHEMNLPARTALPQGVPEPPPLQRTGRSAAAAAPPAAPAGRRTPPTARRPPGGRPPRGGPPPATPCVGPGGQARLWARRVGVGGRRSLLTASRTNRATLPRFPRLFLTPLADHPPPREGGTVERRPHHPRPGFPLLAAISAPGGGGFILHSSFQGLTSEVISANRVVSLTCTCPRCPRSQGGMSYPLPHPETGIAFLQT